MKKKNIMTVKLKKDQFINKGALITHDMIQCESLEEAINRIEQLMMYRGNGCETGKLRDILEDVSYFKINDIFKKQYELQDKLNKNPRYMCFMDRMRYMQDNATHLNIEFAECLRHFPFKYWKKYPQSELNGFASEEHRKRVAIEMIDMLCFFMNILLSIDITPEELYNLYMEKNDINFKRQDNNY